MNPQDLADDQITMVVDQANAFAFKIDDIEERQSHVNFEALATSSGAYSLKRKYDAVVLDLMATDAGLTGESGVRHLLSLALVLLLLPSTSVVPHLRVTPL